MNASGLPAWIRDRRLVGWLLFLAALVVYLPAISGGSFHFDDMHSIVENPGVRSLSNIPRYFVDPSLWSGEPGNAMYRPTLLVTYAVDFAIAGYKPAVWLLTNVLIHAAAAVLVYRLAARLRLSDLASLFAGAVFALHPAISETQNYVSSRSESVAAVTMLAALHVYLGARDAVGGRRVVLFAAALALSCLAVLTKETTAVFFLAAAWLELVAFGGSITQRLRRAIVPAVVFGAGLVAVMLLRRHLLGVAVAKLAIVNVPGADVQVGGGRSVVANMLTQSNAQIVYWGKLLAPVGLNVDYDLPIVDRLAGALPAIAVLSALAVAAVAFAVRGARLIPLCVGWYAAFSLVTFVIPLNVVMNEHRLYLPMIAVALLAGAALARVAELLGERFGSAAKGAALAAAPLVCFVPLIVQRSREWRDDATLWAVAVERAPSSARAHQHVGAAWHTKANAELDRDERVRLLDKALEAYATSDTLHAGWSDLQLDIGSARFTRGQATHDRADFEKALAAFVKFGEIVGPSKARPRLLQAAAYAELGDVDRAIDLNRKVASEDTDVTRIYDDQLAHFLRRKGDKKGAAEAMQRVIALDEKNERVDGLLDLGWWHVEDGDLDGGAALIGRAFDISKKSGDTRPPLYIARFLRLVGQADNPKVAEMEATARHRGWSAPPEELRWVMGGPTPGVFTGTASARASGPPPPR